MRPGTSRYHFFMTCHSLLKIKTCFVKSDLQDHASNMKGQLLPKLSSQDLRNQGQVKGQNLTERFLLCL